MISFCLTRYFTYSVYFDGVPMLKRAVIDQCVKLHACECGYRPSILTPCIIVMCGRRDPLDNYPEVRHSTSSRRLPQKCTSLEPNIILPKYPDLGPRLDLGCGKKPLVKPSLPQPVKFISGIGSGYWILECAKLWRVCPRPYRRRSNKPTYFYAGALSELRVRR